MRDELPNTAEEAAQKWAHPALLKIWIIVQMPDWDETGPILHEKGINEIGKAVLELNNDFNKPEIKLLYHHLKEMI